MEPRLIGGCVLLAILGLATVFLYNKQKSHNHKSELANLSFDGLLIALIMILAFVPQVGYLTIVPGLSLTLIHLPVLLGAMVGGRRKGLLLGTAFGFTSFIQALGNGTGLNALFALPYISIPPRMLFGYLSGLVFEIVFSRSKGIKRGFFSMGLCFVLTLMHTALVFGDLYLFAFSEINAIMTASSILGTTLTLTVAVIILLGAIGEAILAAFVVPLIAEVLQKATPSLYKRVSFMGK